MPAAGIEGEVLGKVLETRGDRVICQVDIDGLLRARELAEPGRRAASTVGGLIKIAVADTQVVGSLTELGVETGAEGTALAEVEFMGQGPSGPNGELLSFRRGITLHPLPGDVLRIATAEDMRRIFSPHDVEHIQVGTVYPTQDVRAPIFFNQLLSRHFAVIGSTGTGKSTTVALLLNRIISAAPKGHVVVLDPHGEYSRAFGKAARVWDVSNLQIPYWIMNLEEHCEAFITTGGDDRQIDAGIMAKCLLKARQKSHDAANLRKITADSPVSYRYSDLVDALQDEAGRLEKQADAQHYTRLRMNIEQLFADRRFDFVFNAGYLNNSLTELLGDLLRIPVDDKPVSIIDLAGVPSEIVDVVVSILARLIFDYAIWSPREQRLPVLLVCEEAQRYLPNRSTETPISVQRQLDRIAREGRKYGVSLGLITQRPSEVSETALSQCGTVVAMRLNNQKDQAQVKAILSEGLRSFVDIIPALQNRECIVCGEGVPVPMRVRLDALEPEFIPASQDPVFSERWNSPDDGIETLSEAVRRWREEG